jgi:short-subunit dehydrogenase
MPTALVTGATAGIGAAFARALAARGDDLVLVARDTTRLEDVAVRLRETAAVDVEVLPADLSVREDVLKVAARLEDPDRPIDVLVNNAGFGLHSNLLDADTGRHEYALDVMCLAVLILGGAAGRAMRARGRGRIINVASLAAWLTQGHYSAIKAWVRIYSESLAGELHGTGVTVTALCPGWVRTEFHERAGIRTSAIPDWVWVDADRCAADALADAERGTLISVPTKRWKLARFALDLAPRAAIHAASRLLTKSRR